MKTPSQLEIVRREIADIKAEILKTNKALAATQNTTDVGFLRKRLEHLDRKEIILRQQETILLQGQASVLGKVGFRVTAQQGEFPDFEFELTTSNNEVLLEDVEKRLGWHNPPLRLKTVNNVPATARPSNKTLAANFKDGDRLELMADIAPDPPEGRARHQNETYKLAWVGAMLVGAGIVLTAVYNFSSWIVKLTTGKGK